MYTTWRPQLHVNTDVAESLNIVCTVISGVRTRSNSIRCFFFELIYKEKLGKFCEVQCIPKRKVRKHICQVSSRKIPKVQQ